MKRKLIALTLVCSMMVSLSLAVAADEVPIQPTVEEILNEYHQEAFEALTMEDTATTSTISPRGGNSKILEQETVDTLMEAGYEAYNVTADNYESLEAQLQTNFTAMGLEPDGSYIVVISGEEPEVSAPNRGNSTFGLTPLPGEDQAPDGGESTFFTYTYNNKTYNMRYVTVTPTENSALGRTDHVVLNDKLSPNNLLEIIGMTSSVVGYLSDALNTVSIFNTSVSISLLLLDLLPDYTPKLTDMVRMTGRCVWTVKYTQIYDFDSHQWFLNAGVEYVTAQKYVDYDIYNPSTHLYDHKTVHYDNVVIYSALYNDTEVMKQRAVDAYEYGQGENRYLDQVESVDFEYGEDRRVVLTIHRTSYDFVD